MFGNICLNSMSFILVPIDFSARIKSTSLSFNTSALVIRAISVHEVNPMIRINVLMEGLRNLSPRRLQVLLVDCRSIKVKRLFLFMADRHNHAWFRRLDMTRIDLGSGKRSLIEGGRYDPKYRITVPETLVSSADDV